MVDPRLVLIYVGLAVSWFLGEKAWHGIKFLGHVIKVSFHHIIH